MIPPDSDQTPEIPAGSQRALAAIVFTDTVGFSAMMSRNEERTLQLVGRDLDYMKAICEGCGGQVLKSTGDGLLMLFNSAVQAVACSLDIQRAISKRNAEAAKEDILLHRIGIHLGDVFQHGGDVMGDGVNIAARLQTQAVPGGICMSNTVFEVVNNRLPFYVNDLGARKLKNIGMVRAYQISPLESKPSGFRLDWYRFRPWLWRGGWLVAFILIILFTYHMGVEHFRMQKELKAAQSHQPVSAPAANTGVAPAPAIQPEPVLNQAAPAASSTEASLTEFDLAKFNYMRKYDFDGMQQWMTTHDWPGKNTSPLNSTCSQLEHLFKWTYLELNKHTESTPLIVITRGKTIYYWPAPFDGINSQSDNLLHTFSRAQMAPVSMVGIISELLKDSNDTDVTGKQQLQQELQLFIKVYRLQFLEKLPAARLPPSNP
jgi:class 3 adenylate cyclase